jgi:CBS domain-containing protein
MPPIPAHELKTHHRIDFLTRLRDARALVLKDAESFHTAAGVLEYIGQILKGGMGNGLGAYRDEIFDLATVTGRFDHATISRLFKVVREARNDVVHDGAFVRHMSTRLVDLIVILEESVMAEMTTVGDVMVRTPVSVEPWQLVWHARRLMLENSFSNLPMLIADENVKRWVFVSDVAVMTFLGPSNERDKSRRSKTLDQARKEGLRLDKADCCVETELVIEIIPRLERGPLLVTATQAGSDRLVGIVSAFDLL